MNHRQSLAGYIRVHLSEYEQRLEDGIRQEVFLEELRQLGYEPSLQTFRTLLTRARKKQGTSKPLAWKIEKQPRPASPTALNQEPVVAEQSDDLTSLSPQERTKRRDKHADQFIKPINPLLKNLKEPK